MSSDYRIRIVLGEGEALMCGNCEGLIEGSRYCESGDHEAEAVYIGDPNDMECAVLCADCYHVAEGEVL